MRLFRFGIAALILIAELPFAGCSGGANDNNPQASSPMIIEPHASVGEIRAGMTVDDVVKKLGEPERRTASSLEYSKLGLAVIHDEQGAVQGVMCGDVTGVKGPFAKRFKGRTKEGIGMNSTRAEVLKEYGEPTHIEKWTSGMETLQYPEAGINFTLEGGKVHHIAIRLGNAQNSNPNRTVELEPAK
jgi:hypothetical protein